MIAVKSHYQIFIANHAFYAKPVSAVNHEIILQAIHTIFKDRLPYSHLYPNPWSGENLYAKLKSYARTVTDEFFSQGDVQDLGWGVLKIYHLSASARIVRLFKEIFNTFPDLKSPPSFSADTLGWVCENAEEHRVFFVKMNELLELLFNYYGLPREIGVWKEDRLDCKQTVNNILHLDRNQPIRQRLHQLFRNWNKDRDYVWAEDHFLRYFQHAKLAGYSSAEMLKTFIALGQSRLIELISPEFSEKDIHDAFVLAGILGFYHISDQLQEFHKIPVKNINWYSLAIERQYIGVTSKGELEVSLFMEWLLSQNINLEARNLMGQTYLMCAILQDKIKIVELLISRGANVNCEDLDGYTPLHYTRNRKILVC